MPLKKHPQLIDFADVLKRGGPVHDDGGIGTLDFNTDVSGGLGCYRLRDRAQGDRHKRLRSIDPRALAVFAQPAVHDVGVDAMLQCDPGNGRSGLGAGAYNLQLELRAVETPLAGWCGASFARHGVHDVHRAHYLWMSARLQGVFAGRIRNPDAFPLVSGATG